MRIELLGTAFSIETDEDPEYLAELVSYFKNKVGEVKDSVRTTDPLKIAILSGLLVSDELHKLQARAVPEDDTADRILADLITHLDRTLEGRPEQED
jgi:cell division protein ZapA (FtsZ GTPase activity inhibitor)